MSAESSNDPFADAVAAFADAIAANFALPVPANSEDQLKTPMAGLLDASGAAFALNVNHRTEVREDDIGGRPDLGVTVAGLLTGHIELKAPEIIARAERLTGENRKQWERFKALPNLIYTNGHEWHLYHQGEHVARARIADDITMASADGLDSDGVEQLRALLSAFLHWQPQAPRTARRLAEVLAPLTRILRDEVSRALERGDTALTLAAAEWRELLFPGADDPHFADAYAQTLTYSLLLAQFEGAETLGPAAAREALAEHHSLLAEALNLLEHETVRSAVRMPIELLEALIAAVDPSVLKRDGDPWLYFYEDFLSAYDPKLRKDRGVYFTPVEVVHAQVHLIAELLRTRFNKPLAFAEDGVTVLDPAAGTGTYPLAVIDHAVDAVRGRFGDGAVGEHIERLAARLHAFEILVGPYSVAHLRLMQRLREVTGDMPAERVNVYLTDTLDSPFEPRAGGVGILEQRLYDEHERARIVKRDVDVLVCLGNPPYDRESHDPDETGPRKGGWVRKGDDGDFSTPILEDFLAPVRDAGQGVHLKNVYNDYVYFWRWALWRVLGTDERASNGIVSFITASSYLRGPGFAGMREYMRRVFDDIWIIDLEGDSLGTRKTENVFAIRTPVAIAIGVRAGVSDPEHPARVRKTKLTGTEKEKLERLDGIQSFDDLDWQECSQDWGAPFYPAGEGSYFNSPLITDIFPWQHSGAEVKRSWPIGETVDVLNQRWSELTSLHRAGRQRAFRETRDRKIAPHRPYPSLLDASHRDPPISALAPGDPPPSARRYAFRSFDRQWILADSRLGDFLRPALWRGHSDAQVYLTAMNTEVVSEGPAAVAAASVPDLHHFRGSFGGKHVIPLWRDVDATQPT